MTLSSTNLNTNCLDPNFQNGSRTQRNSYGTQSDFQGKNRKTCNLLEKFLEPDIANYLLLPSSRNETVNETMINDKQEAK